MCRFALLHKLTPSISQNNTRFFVYAFRFILISSHTRENFNKQFSFRFILRMSLPRAYLGIVFGKYRKQIRVVFRFSFGDQKYENLIPRAPFFEINLTILRRESRFSLENYFEIELILPTMRLVENRR